MVFEKSQLLEAAVMWHEKGVPVIPFTLTWNEKKQEYEKRPVVETWKQWQDRAQTEEEFDALKIEDYSIFGLVCGAKLTVKGETVYLVGVDRDIKDPSISEDVKQKTLQAINQMRTTYREKTRSGGNHLIYFSRTPVKGAKPSKTGMELLSHGQLMIISPSEGYTRENDDAIATVDNAEVLFYDALGSVGLHKEPAKSRVAHVCSRNLKAPRPCIVEALKQQLTSGNGHLMRLAIAAEYKRLGYTDSEIVDLFRSQGDFNHDVCMAQVRSADSGKTANCRTVKEYGYCLPNCQIGQPILLSHINEIENPELSGIPVSVEAVVSSTSISYMIPSEISAVTKEENQEPESEQRILGIENPVNLSLVAIQDETKLNRLKKLFQGKVLSIDIKKYRTVYLVRVRPPVSTLVKQGTKLVDDKDHEYKYLDLYIATDKPLTFQPSEQIFVTGLPLPHPRTQKTTLLAYEISFPEKIEKFDYSKLYQLKAKLGDKTPKERLTWILDNCELYTHIIGRRNIAKAVLLCAFTPTYVSLFSEVQHGWGLVDVIGDSTVGKSETVKKIVLGLLKAGMYVSAETASIVGLVGAAVQGENGGWFIEWGFLPLMDRRILAMDGCHKLSASQWAVTAEAERSGEVTIIKAGKGNAYARTRQIKIFNAVDRETDKYTTKPLAEFLYPVQALATVEDKTSIARRDLAVFADQRDVTPEQINNATNVKHEPELELLAEALKWAWLDKAQVTWTPDAQKFLLEKATALANKFHYDRIPLISADMKWKLARLSVSMAYLTLSTDDFTKLLVTKDHVSLVCETLEEEYSRAGLNVLAQTERMERLTIEDVQALLKRIVGQLTKEPIDIERLIEILKFILLSGGTTQEQLKAKFELTEKNQLRPLMAILQTEGLVKVNRGYYQTAKLVEVHKVTNGFAALACRAEAKNEHPPHETEKTGQAEGRGSFSEVGKDGTNGKALDESSKQHTTEQTGFNPEDTKPVKAVKPQPVKPAPSRSCGDCGCFHTLNCQHPVLAMGGDPELVKADSGWACECKGWIDRTEATSSEELLSDCALKLTINLQIANHKEGAKILKAIVIVPNEKTTDLGSLLAIARSEACKREHTQENPIVRAITFVAELGVYVAVYQVINHAENGVPKNRIEK